MNAEDAISLLTSMGVKNASNKFQIAIEQYPEFSTDANRLFEIAFAFTDEADEEVKEDTMNNQKAIDLLTSIGITNASNKFQMAIDRYPEFSTDFNRLFEIASTFTDEGTFNNDGEENIPDGEETFNDDGGENAPDDEEEFIDEEEEDCLDENDSNHWYSDDEM